MEGDEYFFQTLAYPLQTNIDLDLLVAIGSYTNPWRNTIAKHIIKVCRIYLETARNTLDITLKNCGSIDNPDLSRKYSTNKKILKYKLIKEYLFIDTLFVTKKAGKYSRGHTCCQLFVAKKGYYILYP